MLSFIFWSKGYVRKLAENSNGGGSDLILSLLTTAAKSYKI